MSDKEDFSFASPLASYGRIKIFEAFPFNRYVVSAVELTQRDTAIANALIQLISRKASFMELEAIVKNQALIEEIRQAIVQPIDSEEMISKFPSPESAEKTKNALLSIAKKLNAQNPLAFAQNVFDETIGFRAIAPLMQDENLEEIMVNGFNKPVFVFHKKFGCCQTNIIAREKGFLREILSRIAASAGRQFSEQSPLLDARLPDGSRANATLQYVTPLGDSLTIRKFSKIPLSIVDIIMNNTVSSELAAFFWAMVEGLDAEPKNIIVTGSAGSGKTTLVNILSFFIRKQERIISIEDTLEIDLMNRDNWVEMEAKPKFSDVPAVSMDDLLKNALRMRPDRIIVGEVRGEEAQTLYVAMDTGHEGILGTLHSNNAREMLLRLKSPPMSVPEQMLPLLDLIVVMQRSYDREKGMMRRIRQVAEVSRMDDKVLLGNIFEYNEKKDSVARTDVPSHVFEELSQRAGMEKNELKKEMLVRQKILEWMVAQKITSNSEVEKIIQEYYYKPELVLKKATGKS